MPVVSTKGDETLDDDKSHITHKTVTVFSVNAEMNSEQDSRHFLNISEIEEEK
jgi:hypothetical protein